MWSSQLLDHFRPESIHRLLQHQAAVPRPGGRAAGPGLQRAGAVWRAGAAPSATRCWCSLPTAAARCWWPPTWPRAGCDIANLAAVINVDVTPDPEVHIHRIGRTGRGDAQGLALNLASMDRDGLRGQDRSAARPRIHLVPLARPEAHRADGPAGATHGNHPDRGWAQGKIRAGDVLGALTGDMGYTREQVGKINVNDFSTYVAVDCAIAARRPRRA